MVPVPVLAGAARGHPRASPPPVLSHHHRHHPHQLPHDDPHTLGADRIYRVSILTVYDLRRIYAPYLVRLEERNPFRIHFRQLLIIMLE